jgi:hypothetical protein
LKNASPIILVRDCYAHLEQPWYNRQAAKLEDLGYSYDIHHLDTNESMGDRAMTRQRATLVVAGAGLLLFFFLAACTLPSTGTADADEPHVYVLGPPDYSKAQAGDTVIVRAVVTDAVGISQTDLQVGGEKVYSGEVDPDSTVTELTQYLFWRPQQSGVYTIQVLARNSKGITARSTPVTMFVEDNSIELTRIAVLVATNTPDPFFTPPPTFTPLPTFTLTPVPTLTYTPILYPTLTPNPTPTATPFATVTAIPTPTSTPWPTAPYPTPTGPAGCYDNSEFVEHVTYPDNSTVPPGASFNKIWRVKNTGSCVWDSSYQIVYVAGTQLSQQSAYPLPEVVYPGQSVDVSVPMSVSASTATYFSQWQLRNPTGTNFGALLQLVIIVR